MDRALASLRPISLAFSDMTYKSISPDGLDGVSKVLLTRRAADFTANLAANELVCD